MDYLIWSFLILLLCLSHSTWAPFQSDQVKAICAHMTAEERSETISRSTRLGAILGLSIGGCLFIGFLLSSRLFDSPLLRLLGMLLPLLILIAIAFWKLKPITDRSQKEFLASTQWAKNEGLSPNDIVLRR